MSRHEQTNVSVMLEPDELARLERLTAAHGWAKAELLRQGIQLLEQQSDDWWRGLKPTRTPGGR